VTTTTSPAYEGIVILGVPRSGTTLVRRLLDAHPRIACPPETNLLSGASRFLQEHQFAGGLSVGVVPGLDFAGFREAEVLERLREFVFDFWRAHARRAGKARWAEKTAVDVFHLDAIERVCGARCRYVCVVRHPLDVVCSIKELADTMQSHLPELFAYVQRNPAQLEAFAQAWRDGNERLLRFCADHPDWTVRLRYEDLTRQPTAELARVLDFLGEETDVDALLDQALGRAGSVGLGDWKTYDTTSIQTSSVGRHSSLSRWTLERLAPIVNPTMERLGYVPIESQIGNDSADRRRDELSRRVAEMKLQGARPLNDSD
jgi:protein-tyrosine sulfotransferase